jgi:hypothetical protein
VDLPSPITAEDEITGPTCSPRQLVVHIQEVDFIHVNDQYTKLKRSCIFFSNYFCIEDLHVTSSMTLRTVAAMLEVFFCAAQDVLMEITLENRPFFRADRNVPMHQIKPELRRQDLEGIHLPSFRFSWKLKKLCRVDFFVFESWQTAVKSQGKTITFQILMSKPRFD